MKETLLEKVKAECPPDLGALGTSWVRAGDHLTNEIWVRTCTSALRSQPLPDGSQDTDKTACILWAEDWMIPLWGPRGAQKKRQKLAYKVLLTERLDLHPVSGQWRPLVSNPTFSGPCLYKGMDTRITRYARKAVPGKAKEMKTNKPEGDFAPTDTVSADRGWQKYFQKYS